MRKRTVFVILLFVLLVFLAGCIPNIRPNYPSNPSPADGSTDVSVNTNLSWSCSDPDDDSLEYDVYFGKTTNPGLESPNQTNDYYDPGTLDSNTTYYWRIKAKDGWGGETTGQLWSFTTEEDNNPPNYPTNPSPANGSTDVSVNTNLIWNCNDPDGDSLTYDIYLGKTTNPSVVKYTHGSNNYDPVGSLDPDTTYYWKIKAKDGKGGETTGPLWSFTTEAGNSPPNTPSNPSPSNGSIDQSINTNLSWTCSDPEGDDLTYDIYFGTSSNPPAVYYEKSTASYDPGTLEYDETYYWKIVAWDENGASTEGPVWHFSTEADNYSPETPSNPSPANGSTDVSVNTNLSWNCSDPDGDSLVYDVYFGESSSPPKVSSDQSSKSYDPGTLEEGKTYYWKIKAKDGNEGETTGPVWHFTTEGAYGEIYGNVQPYDGYVTSSNEILNSDLSNFSSESPEEYIEGEYIVGINRDYGLKDTLTALKKDEMYNKTYSVKDTLETADKSFAYMLIESELSLDELKNELKTYSWFKNIERNYVYEALDVYEPEVVPEIYPNDYYYDYQWHYETINLPTAWSQTTGSINVVVAVLDTGVRFEHPDLNSVFWATGYDFVDNDTNPTDPGTTSEPNALSHGTHVAGTIAALSNNSVGVAGVNWGGTGGTKILPIRVLGPDGGSSFVVAQGIVYAVEHGAKVINMSFGSTGSNAAVEDACTYGYENDVVLVAAAGNDDPELRYPAKYPEVFAVGAVGYDLQKAYYSNYGPEIDFVAPGGDIRYDKNGDGNPDGVLSTSWSINSGNGYFYMQGTSMAAPHVAGVVALMISNGLTGVEDIRSILQDTARDLGDHGFDNYYGYGLIDAYSAVTYSDGWEPLMVYNTDSMWNVDSVSVVNPDGSYNLQVNLASSYVFVWQDFDHDGDIGYGDLYGYYGYPGGDPDDDYPSTVSVTAGGQTEANFEFGVYIDQTYKPVENFDKVIEKKEQIIKEHYEKIK